MYYSIKVITRKKMLKKKIVQQLQFLRIQRDYKYIDKSTESKLKN